MIATRLFCTRLEQRFTRRQIEDMLSEAGFGDIRFSDRVPYRCAVGKERRKRQARALSLPIQRPQKANSPPVDLAAKLGLLSHVTRVF